MNKVIAVIGTVILVLAQILLWAYAIAFWAVMGIPWLLIESAAWAWEKSQEEERRALP